MKTKLTKRGDGLKKLKKLAEELHTRPHVKVGILGNADRGSSKQIGVLELGIIHEFGVARSNIPPRSFLRATADMKRGEWTAFGARLLKMLATGRMQIPQALGLMGERARADIVHRIQRGLIPPPNAPATIRAKGSSRPLIDTGRLVQSISYQVEGGPAIGRTVKPKPQGLKAFAKSNAIRAKGGLASYERSQARGRLRQLRGSGRRRK